MLPGVTGRPLRTGRPLDHKGSALEKAPPWLASMVLHLCAVIAFGLLSIGPPPGSVLDLVFVPDDSLSDEELDLGGTFSIETPADQEPAAALVDLSVLEVPSEPTFDIHRENVFPVGEFSGLGSVLAGLGDDLTGDAGLGYTSVFGLQGEGARFVYVFDRSESMNSVFVLYREEAIVGQVTPLGLAKAELLRSLNTLDADRRFQIVFYNHMPIVFGGGAAPKDLFRATRKNKREARELVERVPGAGNTDHWSALQAALPLRPDVIFLITDGEAKDDPPMYRARSLGQLCRRQGIQVNVVHFSDKERPGCSLIRLAEESGGAHQFIDVRNLVRGE